MSAHVTELEMLREIAALGPGGQLIYTGEKAALAFWLIQQKLARGAITASNAVITGLTTEGHQALRNREARTAQEQIKTPPQEEALDPVSLLNLRLEAIEEKLSTIQSILLKVLNQLT